MRLPNFFTSACWPLCAASLPHSTSIMPPLAAFIMKVLSAALNLPAVLPAGLAVVLAVGAGAFAPVLSGGYVFSALLVIGRQSAPAASARTEIREMIRFLFISVCSLAAAIRHQGFVSWLSFGRGRKSAIRCCQIDPPEDGFALAIFRFNPGLCSFDMSFPLARPRPCSRNPLRKSVSCNRATSRARPFCRKRSRDCRRFPFSSRPSSKFPSPHLGTVSSPDRACRARDNKRREDSSLSNARLGFVEPVAIPAPLRENAAH